MCWHRLFLLVSASLACSVASTHEVTDTLSTDEGDRIIVTYDVTKENDRLLVTFREFSRRLSSAHRDRYDLSNVVVMFFDHISDQRNYKFSGRELKPMIVAEDVSLAESEDGIYLLRNGQPLTLKLGLQPEMEGVVLKIPLFLVNYKDKNLIRRSSEYEVFAQSSKYLTIRVPSTVRKTRTPDPEPETVKKTVVTTTTEELEVGGDLSEAEDMALSMASEARRLIASTYSLPMPDELVTLINDLRVRKHSLSEAARARIDDVTEAYDEKKRELEEDERNEALHKAQQEERLAAQRAADAQEQADSAEKERLKAEKAERDRNFWLIVVGIVLAVLAFVANQVMRYRRDAQNSRSIREMQENMEKRAENEVKRRTIGSIRSKVGQAEGRARNASRDALNKGVNKIIKGKGKNKFSI